MTASAPSNAASAILAILLEAKQAGVGKITRTTLVKYLYLLDLYMAEEHGGNTWTDAPWVFLHFGPYAQTLADDIDMLASRGLIQEIAGGGGTDKDYTLYTVGEWSQAKSFESLGFPLDVRLNLSNDIRKFSGDLPLLLDKIYFHTAPMRRVRPGQRLSFESARKANFKVDVKPVKIPVADPAKAAKIRELARKIGEDYLKSSKSAPENFMAPVRDEYFAQAAFGDDEGLIEGEFTAELTFAEE